VADDVVGGFFAINQGGLGSDPNHIYYWAPDSLEWEPLEIGFTDFFVWSLTSRLVEFYAGLRWKNWRDDIRHISGDTCFAFYPFLWTEEGSVETSYREPVAAHEAFAFNIETLRQYSKSGT
jgi:hypothetical protein